MSKKTSLHGVEMYKPQFAMADILRAVNNGSDGKANQALAANNVNKWVTRGVLLDTPQKGDPGGMGKRRAYNAIDTIQIAALYYLTLMAIPPTESKALLYYFIERSKELIKGDKCQEWIMCTAGDSGKRKYSPVILAKDEPVALASSLDVAQFINVDGIINRTLEALKNRMDES